jgi:hypothetical protein
LLIAKDYDGPDVESEVLIEGMRARRKAFCRWLARRPPTTPAKDPEYAPSEKKDQDPHNSPNSDIVALSQRHVTPQSDHGLPASQPSTFVPPSQQSLPSGVTSATPTVVHSDDDHARPPTLPHSVRFKEDEVLIPTPALRSTTHSARLWRKSKKFLYDLLAPSPFTVLISLPIALVDPLKALFVPVSDTFTPSFHPIAPDGDPPLAFILDTATFVGNASVPIGLILLGSALARLNVGGRENWARMPRGAIAALAVGKMLVSPVLGVLIVQAFVRCGLLNKEDKVLQFVCLYVVFLCRS